jgi:galactoside O-acetyltransferase
MEDSYYTDRELSTLGFCRVGQGCKVSKFARFYGISQISLSNNVRIDDFAVISVASASSIGDNVHIGAMSLISSQLGFEFGAFSTFSSRVTAYGQNDDYSGSSLTNPTVSESLRGVNRQRLLIGNHVIVGTGSVILPQGTLADGVAVGALTLIKEPTLSWGIYAGIPARRVKERSRNLLNLEYKN